MDKDSWIAVNKYYGQLLGMSEKERLRLLTKLEAEDPAVADLLKSLLKDGGETHADLKGPAVSEIHESDDPTKLIGQIIGNYKLTYLIGLGGMGKVYLADRMDLEAHQQVAIKIISAGSLSDINQKRFDRERKILSKLNHPHITRIYDGGISEAGDPYIIMEYVEGMDILEHVTENKLNLNQRIELFLDLCEAVDFAHRNFIMHRDLKPGNILVTNHGIVKVIDFGIAKILEDETSEEDLTMMGYMPLTPAYASPEQLTGQPLTMASDIYTLGVILYELLTGNKPFPGNTKTNIALTERIRHNGDAVKPSTRIDPAITRDLKAWQKNIKGDVDNIVLKALKENPNERYVSADQLADDLKRYQNNFPVLAQADNVSYRFKKYAQRNQSLVVVGVLLVLILFSGIGATVWQASKVAIQRDHAKHEAQKAQEITRFVTDLFKNSDPDKAKGKVITSETMLAQGSEKLNDLDGQPVLQAEMYRVIGDLYRKQNLFVEAEAHLLHSLQLFEQELGAEDVEVAETKVLLAELYTFQNRSNETIEMSRSAATVFKARHGSESTEFVKAQNYLARGQIQLGKYQEALSVLLSVIGHAEKWEDRSEKQSAALTSLYNDIGSVYNGLGDHANYKVFLQKAITEIFKTKGEINQNVSALYNNLGHSFYFEDELDSAKFYTLKALKIADEVYGGKSNDRAQFAHSNLAKIYIELDDLEEALKHAELCYAMSRDVYGDVHMATGRGLSILGDVYIATGDYSKSEAYREEATLIYEAFYGGVDPMLAWLYWDEADRYYKSGNLNKAIAYKRKCIDMYERTMPEELNDLAEARHILAGFLLEVDSSRAASALLEKSLAHYTTTYGEGDENTISITEDLIRAYDLSNQSAKASALRSKMEN